MEREKSRLFVPEKKKAAFVCSGGATKAGAFHLGVALAIRERGFEFLGGVKDHLNVKDSEIKGTTIQTYVGSSAGSIICSLLAGGFNLDQIFHSFLGEDAPPGLRPMPKLTYKCMFKIRPELAAEQLKLILGVRTLIKSLMQGKWEAFIQGDWLKFTGIFSTKGIEEYLREEVLSSNRFQDILPELFLVATQLNHSRKVVFGPKAFTPPPHDPSCLYLLDVAISDACAASIALPFIYAPYGITQEGREIHYIDGEVRDTLSTHVAVDAGADLVFASYTHQPYHYARKFGSLLEKGLPAILIQSLYLLIEQKINNYIHNKETQARAFESVDKFCLNSGVSDEHRRGILEILEKEFHFRRDVTTIYIHPKARDVQMFFGEHFTLSPTRMAEYVRCGFRAGIEALSRYEFQNLQKKSRTTVS